MWSPHEPVQVEASFDLCVAKAGGKRVLSMLTKPPTFENADYAFAEAQVVGELKELETDFSANEALRERHFSLMQQHVVDRRMTVRQVLGVDRHTPDFVEDFVRLFRPPIARVVKKANRQLKSTKEHLGWPEASGVLFLVNDGFTALEPHLVQALVSDILTSSYSSVDCFVYMTVNTYVDLPGSPFANLLWVPTYSPRAPDRLVAFIDDLGRTWGNVLDSLIGPADSRTETPDRSILSGSRAIKGPMRGNDEEA